MSRNTLLFKSTRPKIEAGRKVLPTPNGPDHNRCYKGAPKMSVDSQYNDSARVRNTEQSKDNWKPISELARALAEKAGDA